MIEKLNLFKSKLKNAENTYVLLLSFFLFVFCFAPKISTVILIFTTLYFIFQLIKKRLVFQFNPSSYFLVFLYLLYMVWIVFTRHPDIAFKNLETKLSLLIFPFLFSFRLKDSSTFLHKITIGLILGLFVSTTIGLINSFNLFLNSKSIVSFLSSGISPIHHPTYFVVFHLISCLLVFYGFKNQWKYFSKKGIFFYLVYSIIIQFLCLSLAGLLFTFMMIFIAILVYLRKRLSVKLFIVSTLIIPISLILIFLKVPYFEGEFHGATKYIETYISDPNSFVLSRKKEISGSEARLIMWTVSFQEILHFPMGVGTGNVDEVLYQNLYEKGLSNFAKKSYNPHNQFFQTTLEVGVLGLLTLVFGAIIWLRNAVISKFWPFVFLVINLFFNSFFESMLQRQSGIVFYSLFICLFSLISLQKLKDENIGHNTL
jgi:O-antigen ligase